MGVAGCTNAQPSDEVSTTIAPMWKEEIDQALADPNSSDFEKQVLSDYQITDSEYQEARQRFKDCMADLGWLVTDTSNGSYDIVGVPGTANVNQAPDSSVTEGCSVGTTAYIELIYIGMKSNPSGVSWAQQIWLCFQRNGVPDGAGMSSDQFERMVTDPHFRASTPQGVLCYWDPTGSGGMTIDQAQAAQNQRDQDLAPTTPIATASATPK
jgi:hypothetical protein